MRAAAKGVLAMAVCGVATFSAYSSNKVQPKTDPAEVAAVQRGIKWLVGVQGQDGGWGQDGGGTSYVGNNGRGNDVANTAVATHALVQAGHAPARGEYRETARRGVEFVVRAIEESPADGLAITRITGTQIQGKLGPFIDTFLAARLLAEVDGKMGDAASNQRVRRALEKTVAKIERNQQRDGSWNQSGGWAPILGTSMASRSLDAARQKGVKVDSTVMARVDEYTKLSGSGGVSGGAADGASGGVRGGVRPATVSMADAGVPLYKSAQSLEQLTRTEKDRKANAKEIREIASNLASPRFVGGYGSMGGEEFFSYLNISDGLRRAGGEPWTQWNDQIKTKLVKLQNEDGTWVGHHCITGRVAVTSAAVLTMLVEKASL